MGVYLSRRGATFTEKGGLLFIRFTSLADGGFSLLLRSYDTCLYFVSQEVWKVSTTSGSRRRKGSFAQEAAALLSQSDLGQVYFAFCFVALLVFLEAATLNLLFLHSYHL